MNNYTTTFLQNLISNKVEENLHLDYKASASLDKQNDKTTEISKDVSAMANSDGGVLIYGIRENRVEKHLPESLDPIDRKQFPKEWLEQIIQDKIQPRISGIVIFPIDCDDEKVVYVVEIPKSNTVHQAYDKKYYKRFNFQSTPMHDYEIRDILNRSKHPDIIIEFALKNKVSMLNVSARNIGSILGNYLLVKVKLPLSVLKFEERSTGGSNVKEYIFENTKRDKINISNGSGPLRLENEYGPARYVPILPTLSFDLANLELYGYPLDYENIIEWEVYCDNAPPKKGITRISDLIR